METELDDEVRFHLDRLIASKIGEGLSPDDARSAALREFGNPAVLQEECRDARGVRWIEDFMQDARFGFRTLRRNPAFTGTAILSLALGLGGATAVFTLFESILLRSLPVARPWELMTIDGRIQQTDSGISFADFRTLAKSQEAFTAVYATSGRYTVRLTLDSRVVDQVPMAKVTHGFFDVLGVRPLAGRFFVPEEDAAAGSALMVGSVAVISRDLWRREFGEDPAAVGRTLLLNQTSCRIVGVADGGFHGDSVGERVDVWVPMTPFSEAKRLDTASGFYAQYMGRLRAGATPATAAAQWTSAYQQIQSTRPKTIFYFRREDTAGWQQMEAEAKDYRVVVEPGALGFDALRTRFEKPLWLMLGATLLVFLIGCANVANLMLSRGLARKHEIAMRFALGAGRRRIVMQILTECLMLSLLAAGIGLLLGRVGSALLISAVDLGSSPSEAPGLEVGLLGWRLAAFLTGLTAAAVLLFGLGPAWRQASRMEPGGGRTIVRRGGERANRLLIVAQAALSVMLLSAALLLGQTIRNLQHQDFGFQPDRTFAVHYWLNAKDSSIEHAKQVSQLLLERVQRLPGVSSAAASTSGFFSGSDMFNTVEIPGGPAQAGARVDFVSPAYFETMGVPLVAGRAFQEVEEIPAAIANEAFVRKFLNGQPAVGMTLRQSPKKEIRIVGVVRDARYRNARIDYEPALFFPHTQSTRAPSRIEVRTGMEDPRPLIGMVLAAIRETDPDVVVNSARPIAEDIDRSFNREMVLAKLAGAFSMLALTLACIGMYGMMSYAISRRMSEFGLRMALGARPGQVLTQVIGDAAKLMGLGVAIGIPCAWAGSRMLEGFLFGVGARDGWTDAGVALALILAGGVAAWIPARRAASVDPAAALRAE